MPLSQYISEYVQEEVNRNGAIITTRHIRSIIENAIDAYKGGAAGDYPDACELCGCKIARFRPSSVPRNANSPHGTTAPIAEQDATHD